MFQIAFMNKEISLTEYVSRSNNNDDTMKFIKFIYGLYVSFKILDLIAGEYITVNEHSIIPDFITELYINDGNIITINKTVLPKIKELFETEKVKTFYNYISVHSRYLTEDNLKQGIKYAFKQIGLDYKQGRVNEPITIRLSLLKSNFRIQKFRFNRNEEDQIVESNINELDDIHYWNNDIRLLKNDNDNRLIEKGNSDIIDIQYKNQPKIQLLKQDFGSDSKHKKDMTLMRHNINAYCSGTLQTTNIFEVCDRQIRESFIEPFEYEFKPSIRYCYTVTKEEVKVEKKQSTLIRQAEITICECGGKYDYSHKSKHMNTAKHTKWINSNK